MIIDVLADVRHNTPAGDMRLVGTYKLETGSRDENQKHDHGQSGHIRHIRHGGAWRGDRIHQQLDRPGDQKRQPDQTQHA